MRTFAQRQKHSQVPICSATSRRIQTKLKVSEPGDQSEQEADRIAEQIMRSDSSAMNADTGRRSLAGAAMTSGTQDHESQESLPHGAGDTLHGSGTPLDPPTRAFMEGRFRHDFSSVRVHTGARAVASAQM